ncbi:uncharacterized protein LOC126562564 [Anopheles maculipalpis]|uniref:uncharacterized protein LOC126562564 n=1 Tax=Anopheles maculipalpis TaxID=1496333 RepID=UPI002158D5FF|nr:uncharacterized protein LOC126562564 [Anopheles maculipalpis]
MANSSSSSLSQAVQHLLERFYDPLSSNEEKHAIDLKLQDLQNTSFNWRISLQYMDTIDNSYLWFFAASTIERTVNLMWQNLNPADQQQLRIGLHTLYENYPCDVPALQRDKVAKIIATIARQQCSDSPGDGSHYGSFVDSVLRLMEHKFFLGLALVGAIGDTVTAKEDSQTSIFGQIVNSYTPSIMQALNTYCASFVLLVRGDNSQTIFDSINAERKNQYCTYLLNVIQQYFSWMKLDRLEPVLVGNITIIACSWSAMHDASISALGSLTELLYRNETLPQETGGHFANSVNHILTQSTLKLADDLYQEKVCDLLRQYVKRGFPYEQENRTRVLYHLLEFTLLAKTPHALMDRINIWSHLCGSRSAEDTELDHCLVLTEVAPEVAHRLSGYLRQTLFISTYPDLETLDISELDESDETELTRFQNQSIDLICELARFQEPKEAEATLLSLLHNGLSSPYVDGYMFFSGMVQLMHGNRELLSKYLDERKTHICMIDYLTACKLVMELATILCCKQQKVGMALQQITSAHIQVFVEINDNVDLFTELLCQVLPSYNYVLLGLSQYIFQIKRYLQMDIVNDQHVRKIYTIIPHEQKSLLLTKLPLFILHQNNCNSDYWNRVTYATVLLLQLFVSDQILGPSTCSVVLDVLRGGIMKSRLLHLRENTRSMLHKTVFTCLTMVCKENGAMPPLLMEQYLCSIGRVVMDLQPDIYHVLPVSEKNKTIVALTEELQQLTCIMIAFDEETSAARLRFASAINPIIEKVIKLFCSTLSISIWVRKEPNNCRLFDVLLEFCNWSVRTALSRTDVSILKEMITLLLQMFETEKKLGGGRLGSVLTLLNIFRRMVNDPHNRSTMPEIVRIILNEFLPMVASDEHFRENKDASLRYEDVLNRLYEVLHDLLHHRWQYFVDTNLCARAESGQPDGRSIVQPEAFAAIMNAYGYALINNREYPTVIKTVLGSLELLHMRRNLFRLPLFIDQLMNHFIKSLLMLALSHVGNMHMEQIVMVLYKMADVDQIRFKVTMCDLGLAIDLTTFHMLNSAQDMPSFQLVIKKIINEIKVHPAN